jgi:lysine-N-methylase
LLKKQIPVSEHKNANEFFWALRSFSLAVITDPRYPLWQRLFILGSFSGRLGDVVTQNRGGLLPKLLNDYSEIIVEKRLQTALEGIPSNPLPQLEVALKFVDRALINMNSRSYAECRSEFLDGIQYDPEKPISSCIPAYTEACARYYRPFMDAHPSMLENYLVDYVLSRCFPMSRNGRVLELGDPKGAYFMMCIHFAVIQTMLIGLAGHYRKEFGTEHVIKLVYSFSRMVEHNAKFLDDVKTYLADANLMNPSGMAILLKNPSD